MVDDGKYVAVVDRIEDGLAVLLLEQDGEQVDELLVSPDELSIEIEQDDVLEIEVVCGEIESVTTDHEETERRKEDAQDRFDRLSRRPPDDEG